jgi:hypothetical protein
MVGTFIDLEIHAGPWKGAGMKAISKAALLAFAPMTSAFVFGQIPSPSENSYRHKTR